MARRSKLNKKLINEAADLVRKGNYAETAAACVGISQATWYSWLKDAREDENPDPLKLEFLEAIEKATAEAEKKYVAVIEKAAPKTWQAAAWWLERRMPEKWGRREHHKVEHSGGVMIVDGDKSEADWVAQMAERRAVVSGNGGKGNGRK